MAFLGGFLLLLVAVVVALPKAINGRWRMDGADGDDELERFELVGYYYDGVNPLLRPWAGVAYCASEQVVSELDVIRIASASNDWTDIRCAPNAWMLLGVKDSRSYEWDSAMPPSSGVEPGLLLFEDPVDVGTTVAHEMPDPYAAIVRRDKDLLATAVELKVANLFLVPLVDDLLPDPSVTLQQD